MNETAVSEGSIQNTASVKVDGSEPVESNTVGITVENNIALWLILLIGSGLVVTGSAVALKKKRK